MKIGKQLLLICLLLTFFGARAQQGINVTGTVSDAMGPLPGASVVVKGTTKGTQTDFDGNYELSGVQPDAILIFSYIGFSTQEISVDGRTDISLTLQEDTQALDEVVVIGYGTQKKSDLTGSIATVKAEEIEKTPAANVMQSLQGKVSGVQIVSAGSPGDSPTVRIRGVGTYGDATNVLYVVDGMFYSNIDFLNPKDIKTVNVLKDASSSAIYGVRAANGVIIIETKDGALNQKPVIEYDGYTGVQVAQNVVKMANAEQFVTMANESGSAADVQFVLNAMQRYGRSRVNPNIPDVNTDWYDEIMRQGIIQNHSLSATGGGENVSYSLGTNYFSQEGLLDMKNEYERFNIRAKVDANLSDNIKVGVNIIFSNATQYRPENSAWFKAYFAVPIIPVIDPLNTAADPTPYSNAQLLGYRGTQNPFPDMEFNNNRLKIRKILTSVYLQMFFFDGKVNYKSTYNHDFSSLEERYVNLPYLLGNNVERISQITRVQNNFSNQIWDNTITYTDSYGDHDLTVLLGSSYRDESRNTFRATGQDITGIDLETSWFLDFANGESFINNVGESGNRFYGLSFFGRVSYDFKDRYLLYATMRADGSSKFTLDPWGYFPSVGAGWVISQEPFMENNSVFDFLKLRASWGKLGNDNVSASAGSNTIQVIQAALDDQPAEGVVSTNVFSNNTWEVIEEMNFGLNAVFFDNQLSQDADYYIRDTENAILPVFVPIVNLFVDTNAGVIRNQGLELNLNWTKQVSDDFNYTIGANFTTLKNKATQLPDPGYIDGGTAEFRQRTQLGGPLFAFYGYETTGVYQNQAQIEADPAVTSADVVPGDLIYKDQNGDNIIDDDDRVIIGSILPDFTFGGNVGVDYRNWGFSMNFYGQIGNQILNRKRGEVIFTNDTNMDADLAINRWHGEGTSNTYPSSAGLRKGWNQRLSNFWVEDGDFFRIQNIQLSYTILGDKLGGNMPDTKLTLTAERPFTFFDYNGFNPEVPDGVDRQTYPVPAVYTLGVNVKF